MKARNRQAGRQLFESVGEDGTRWAFVITSDEGWSITRNGKSVAGGTAARASVQAGVSKFAALVHGVPGTSSRDRLVQRQLDLIESQIKAGDAASASGPPSEDGRR